MVKRADNGNTTTAPASTAIKVAWACVGECAWLLASMLAAAVFLVVFVLLAEPVQASTLGTELGSAVNVMRMIVLTAALWLWAYIARTTRAAGPKQIRREQAEGGLLAATSLDRQR